LNLNTSFLKRMFYAVLLKRVKRVKRLKRVKILKWLNVTIL